MAAPVTREVMPYRRRFARNRWTIGTIDMVLAGEISPNRPARTLGHGTIVFGAAVRNVEITKRGVGAFSLAAITLFRQVVASRGRRTLCHQTHVAISVESSVLLSNLGIGTFCVHTASNAGVLNTSNHTRLIAPSITPCVVDAATAAAQPNTGCLRCRGGVVTARVHSAAVSTRVFLPC